MDWNSPAPAKVNLSLNITGRRADGYHDLISFAAFTSYADQLTISDDRPTGLSISGPFAAELQKNPQENLINKTRSAVLVAGFQPQPHHIHLEKHIPVSSGLGGGSSNVAAYLRCLADMMKLSPPEKRRLFCLAGDIGTDVPVCLRPGYQIMQGDGTDVRPVKITEGVLYCALANPGNQVSTARIFSSLHQKNYSSDLRPFPEQETLQLKDVLALGNDLCEPAIQLCPQIAKLLHQMENSSVAERLLGVGMSGSGASCFALSRSQNVVSQLCDELSACGFWTVATSLIE
tara:strand:- start:1134 stop:2000 length:867 start_codon:yes stop_codon:yes gene_type:complete